MIGKDDREGLASLRRKATMLKGSSAPPKPVAAAARKKQTRENKLLTAMAQDIKDQL